MSFVKSIWFIFVCQTIVGFALGGIYLTVIVLATELVGANYRTFAANSMWLFQNLAYCLMSLQAYWIQEWRKLTLILSGPYLVLVATYL